MTEAKTRGHAVQNLPPFVRGRTTDASHPSLRALCMSPLPPQAFLVWIFAVPVLQVRSGGAADARAGCDGTAFIDSVLSAASRLRTRRDAPPAPSSGDVLYPTTRPATLC